MKQLTGREKRMVAVAGGALVIFVLVQFVIFPLFDRHARLQKRLAVREKAMQETLLMQEQFRKLHQQSGSMAKRLEQREQGFSLFAFLERNAEESEVKEHIAYMKPSEIQGGELMTQSRVEMKLQAVSLEQLLNFLDKSEAPNNLVGIAKCTIQENTKEEGSLDATLVMISVDQTQGATQR